MKAEVNKVALLIGAELESKCYRLGIVTIGKAEAVPGSRTS